MQAQIPPETSYRPDNVTDHIFEEFCQQSTESLVHFVLDHYKRLREGAGAVTTHDKAEMDFKLRLVVIILEARRLKLRQLVWELPPEVLSIIFTFVCHGADDVYPTTLPRVFRLSFVCKRWHTIVVSMPSLWSSLSISFGTWKSDLERLERIVSTFLARSKSSPLSLKLNVMGGGEGPLKTKASKTCIAILRSLVRHSDRWQRLEFRVSQYGLRHPVLQPIIGRMPILRELRLTGVDEPDLFKESISPCDSRALFSACPSLTHVLINGWILESELDLPWSQIRTLELQVIYCLPELTAVLALCPRVEKLRLNDVAVFEEPEDDLVDPVSPIPSIKHLSTVLSDDAGHTFYYLNLPELRSLRLEGFWSGQTWNTKDIHIDSFLERSSCTIISLSLITCPLSDRETISLLQTIPSLEYLRVEEQQWMWSRTDPKHRVVTTFFWKSLVADVATTSSCIVPSLKELTLTFHGGDLDENALLDALMHRSNPNAGGVVACLNRIGLEIAGETPTEKMKESLVGIEKDFKLKGSTFSVKYSSNPNAC
ncbi:hypothetical protein VNI00_014366 [Paramarasmius palmivorus]|uniref:F-box domain-containing protein n=1 Tax=Paramarasmius palmivorus TaxID=297713 RepID=A0AAW0BTE5_9AGAR